MKGIRQLADHLSISTGTVSRALNGKADVNAETRKRVLEAAEKLGYVPNQAGRSLRQGVTGTVGLILSQDASIGAGSENFFPRVIDGLQQALSRHGLDLVLLLRPRGEKQDEFLRRMVARRIVDALIITSTRVYDPRFPFLTKSGMPFVALGRSETSRPENRWADLDFEGIAERAVTRLFERGHRQIALAGPRPDANLGALFLKGYRRGLDSCGLTFDPDLVFQSDGQEAGGYEIGSRILESKHRPSAIVLNAEMMSIGLYRRLGEAGLTPGKDLAIIAERESPVGRFLSPRLTCFRIDAAALGCSLGEMLLSTLPAFAEQYADVPRQQIWPFDLVEGESDPPLQA
ncbi:LacI family DNA-binding transcriptional regulator [Martelella endophytica]|uniref:LacI family transcriptional regulator n=1 Tax=Martelella endophytica TaxID=1486262 RepID=A0A0D5LSF4_MAREN|nr:LacI family DNA-binding transcriptional regulator [Martelella endophytica]AJY46308.1 LacI family transcriptional regulator [Martelella endophytica]